MVDDMLAKQNWRTFVSEVKQLFRVTGKSVAASPTVQVQLTPV